MNLFKTHPARVYGLAVAVLALVADFGIDTHSGKVLGVLAAFLGLAGGDVLQRFEDGKTADALLTPSPVHANLADEG
ncbi:hypothetical protein [Streptomyces sp. NBC_01751]|uniref:hypothetical protein n=1 Tax=Streptomyces sp. NBC_01751 TaxID=2975929 RepID=UPI002DD91646|nr:hypothetical protein [Streptomyces sp. NBC_01751]WSD23376.1 hypothetical protein OHA26_07730 [Streptomyces sp. NBC_01751]